MPWKDLLELLGAAVITGVTLFILTIPSGARTALSWGIGAFLAVAMGGIMTYEAKQGAPDEHHR